MSEEPEKDASHFLSEIEFDLRHVMTCLQMLTKARTPDRRNYWKYHIIRESESIINRLDASWEEDDEDE